MSNRNPLTMLHLPRPSLAAQCLVGGLLLWSATSNAGVLFQEDFSNGMGQFTASGRSGIADGAAVLRGGSSDGVITSLAIDASNFSNLSLQFFRQTSRLDSGEAGRAEIAINGGTYTTIEASNNASGNVSFSLPAAADGANSIVLRFSVDASSYYETYTVDSVVLSGDGSVSEPDEPEPEPGNGETHFWELSGNLGTHDPTIMKEGNIWYEFQTGPGIYRKISFDGGFNWQPLGSIFPSGLWWWRYLVPGQQGTDVWAPDVKAFNGRVWMYYAVSTFGSNTSFIGLASSPSLAEDNWRDDGVVIRSSSATSYNAIDPDLVIDAQGGPWLVFGSWFSGIQLTRLDPATMKPTGAIYPIAQRSGGIEAPTIVYRNGYYYLFVSVGKCCEGTNSTYQIRYGRSQSITGPYRDKNGQDMRTGGGSLLDSGNERWVGPGGQDIYGASVIARHAYDASDDGAPKLLINTLNWTLDNWPRY